MHLVMLPPRMNPRWAGCRMGWRARMPPRRSASTSMKSLPRQLCRLMGRTLLIVRSLCSSFTSGTITLRFHAEGSWPCRRQLQNSCTTSCCSSLHCCRAVSTPV